MIILGIDPGVSGGIAEVSDFHDELIVVPMPDTERDMLDVVTAHQCGGEKPRAAFVEWIHPAIQGIGKSPMSKLYGNYMACRMAVIAAGIRLEIVKPHEWQKALGIPKRTKTETQTKWKNRLKAKAQQLFPDVKVTLKTADALLIAEYGRRQMMGES